MKYVRVLEEDNTDLPFSTKEEISISVLSPRRDLCPKFQTLRVEIGLLRIKKENGKARLVTRTSFTMRWYLRDLVVNGTHI